MTADHDAVAKLVHAYAERLDEGDLDGVAELLRDATLRSDRRPEGRRGREDILRLYRDTVALYDGKPSTKHVTTNLVIEVTGDAATARSYFTVLQARPELPLQPVIAGRYHDRFSRTSGTWRFAERLILVDLVGDLRYHLKVAPPGDRTS